MARIGNIGAISIYSSAEDIPARLKRPGMVFAVHRGGNRVEFLAVAGSRDTGMGIALAAGAAAGSAAGPVGTLIGIGVSVLPMLFGKLFGGGPSKEERGAADAFEARAGATTRLFDSIQGKAVITAADVQAAEAALGALHQMAEQAAGVSYVSRQWNSPAYRPAYEARLNQIRQAAAQQAPAAGAVGATPAGGGGGLGLPEWLAPAGLVAAVLLLVRRG